MLKVYPYTLNMKDELDRRMKEGGLTCTRFELLDDGARRRFYLRGQQRVAVLTSSGSVSEPSTEGDEHQNTMTAIAKILDGGESREFRGEDSKRLLHIDAGEWILSQLLE